MRVEIEREDGRSAGREEGESEWSEGSEGEYMFFVSIAYSGFAYNAYDNCREEWWTEATIRPDVRVRGKVARSHRRRCHTFETLPICGVIHPPSFIPSSRLSTMSQNILSPSGSSG